MLHVTAYAFCHLVTNLTCGKNACHSQASVLRYATIRAFWEIFLISSSYGAILGTRFANDYYDDYIVVQWENIPAINLPIWETKMLFYIVKVRLCRFFHLILMGDNKISIRNLRPNFA